MMRTMTRTPLARLAACLAGAALVVAATPVLASAADYKHTDASRDATVERMDAASKARIDRREASVDIRTVRVSHTASHVVVKVRTRAAMPAGRFFLIASLRVPGGRSYELEHIKMLGTTHSQVSTNDEKVECAGYRADIDRGRRLATLVVPTTCLGDPAWVRAGVGVARFAQKRMWADDGLSNHRVGDSLRYSPRIARG